MPAILPSHRRKRKGSYSQPSSYQYPNSRPVTPAARFLGTPKNSWLAETASGAGWTLRLYNSYKKPQKELATSIVLILELFFVLFPVPYFIRPRSLLSIKPFMDGVREANVHSIFLRDRIVFSSASMVIMASHPRNIFDVIYVDGSE